MMKLFEVTEAGRCDARCYNASPQGRCNCICGGANHGVGYRRGKRIVRTEIMPRFVKIGIPQHRLICEWFDVQWYTQNGYHVAS